MACLSEVLTLLDTYRVDGVVAFDLTMEAP